MGQIANPVQEVIFGPVQAHRLHEHCGNPVGMLRETATQRFKVVVLELHDVVANALRYAPVQRQRARRPIVPAVVAIGGDHVPSGVGPGDAHGGGVRPATGLQEADHLRRGDDLGEQLGDLDLQGVHQRKRRPVTQLTGNGGVNIRVGVAQDHRPQRHRPIDVLVPVNIPHPAATSAFEVDRRYAPHELRRTFTERLRDGGDHALGPLQQCL